MRAYSAAIFVGLDDIVGGDRDQPAIADLHLTMEFEQTFGLTAILGTEAAAAKHDHHRILLLQLGELAMLSGVVAKLIVGKDSALRSYRIAFDLLQDFANLRSTFTNQSRRRLTVARSRSAHCRPPVHRPGPADSRLSLPQVRSRRCGRRRFGRQTARVRRKPRPVRASFGTMAPSGHRGRCGQTKPSVLTRRALPADAAAGAAKPQCLA